MENNNAEINNAETQIGHGEMIGEARTFEEYKGAGVFADLLLDRTFKKAFNPDTQNKVCLIALLNAVLEGEIAAPIVDVQSRDKEYNDGSNENRTSIFDLHCIDSKQRRFIIEVQILFQENIVNRAIYYASQTVIAQGERGKKYNYELKPVVTVVFMEFKVFAGDRYIRRAKLREANGASISDTLNFAFVELPKFKKPLDELETTLDKALYALKNMKKLKQMPRQYAKSVFKLLFSTAKLAKLSKEEQKMIDEAQKAKWDNYAIHKAAVDSGLAQGRDQRNREIAKKMLLDNESVDKTVKYTELSEADVLAIKAALGKS
jgi:predicted transposase/invertase (TIGR01784 family)